LFDWWEGGTPISELSDYIPNVIEVRFGIGDKFVELLILEFGDAGSNGFLEAVELSV